MGFRWSEVQILSPRPIKSARYLQIERSSVSSAGRERRRDQVHGHGDDQRPSLEGLPAVHRRLAEPSLCGKIGVVGVRGRPAEQWLHCEPLLPPVSNRTGTKMPDGQAHGAVNIGPRPRAHLCHAGSERTARPVQPLAAVGYADPRGGIKTPIREQGNDRRARGADRAAPIDAFERPVDRSHAELDDVSPEASWHLRVASQNHRRAVASERVAL
jgi:hypothetical protein